MILVYSKQEKRRFNLIKLGEKEYPYNDDNGFYREHELEVMNANGIRGRETMIFDINDGVSTVSLAEGKQWKIGQEQVEIYKKAGDLFIRNGKVIIKMRPSYERNETTEPFWGFFSKELGTTESGKKELKLLLGAHGFETVKPIEIIRRLIYHSTNTEDIILDFFSGSATTSHATMKLNLEDGGRRKFIVVQIPEKTEEKSETYKVGYKNICEIGKERIRRAGDKIVEENKDKEGINDLDIGFKVFKLDSSNIKPWNPNFDNVEMALEDIVNNFVEGRTEEDVVYEIMLKYGVDLTYPIEVREVNGKKVFSIGFGALIICLDNEVTLDVVNGIVDLKNELAPETTRVVFKDTGFKTDSVKTNAIEILKRNNINEIMSI